jgi:hypothetical protein
MPGGHTAWGISGLSTRQRKRSGSGADSSFAAIHLADRKLFPGGLYLAKNMPGSYDNGTLWTKRVNGCAPPVLLWL